MASGHSGRTALSYFAYRLASPAAMVNYFGSQQVVRLHQGGVEFQENETKKPLKETTVKIGHKTYIIRMVPAPTKKDSGKSINPFSKTPVAEKELPFAAPDPGVFLKQTLFESQEAFPFFSHNQSDLKCSGNALVDDVSAPVSSEIFESTNSLSSLQNTARLHSHRLQKLGSAEYEKFLQDVAQCNSDFQNMIKEYFISNNATPRAASPVQEAYWESIKYTLPDITNTHFHLQTVRHPLLKYKGVIDCIGMYKSEPALIHFTRSLTNFPVFLSLECLMNAVSLLGAFNFDPRFPVQVKNIVVIKAHADASPAFVNLLDEGKAAGLWPVWLSRLDDYWKIQKSGVKGKDLLHDNFQNASVLTSGGQTEPSVQQNQEPQFKGSVKYGISGQEVVRDEQTKVEETPGIFAALRNLWK